MSKLKPTNLKRLSLPELRARYSLAETDADEKARIVVELKQRQKMAKKQKGSGKKPTASASKIYQTKVHGPALRGGRMS